MDITSGDTCWGKMVAKEAKNLASIVSHKMCFFYREIVRNMEAELLVPASSCAGTRIKHLKGP